MGIIPPRRIGQFILAIICLPVLTLSGLKFIGYESDNCFDDPLYGINLKVYHPRFVDYLYHSSGIFDDRQNLLIGMERTYEWSEVLGRVCKPRLYVKLLSEDHAIELNVDRKPYGTVELADTIVIDNGTVSINGTVRTPLVR